MHHNAALLIVTECSSETVAKKLIKFHKFHLSFIWVSSKFHIILVWLGMSSIRNTKRHRSNYFVRYPSRTQSTKASFSTNVQRKRFDRNEDKLQCKKSTIWLSLLYSLSASLPYFPFSKFSILCTMAGTSGQSLILCSLTALQPICSKAMLTQCQNSVKAALKSA